MIKKNSISTSSFFVKGMYFLCLIISVFLQATIQQEDQSLEANHQKQQQAENIYVSSEAVFYVAEGTMTSNIEVIQQDIQETKVSHVKKQKVRRKKTNIAKLIVEPEKTYKSKQPSKFISSDKTSSTSISYSSLHTNQSVTCSQYTKTWPAMEEPVSKITFSEIYYRNAYPDQVFHSKLLFLSISRQRPPPFLS